MNIVMNGVTSINSQLYHIVIDGCKNVKVQGVKVFASGSSPNTDGIHVESSVRVTILSSNIGTGDDCVSIGKGTTNLWIEDMKCGPGHGIRYALNIRFHFILKLNNNIKKSNMRGTSM